MTLSSRAIEAGARAMWDSLKGDTHSGIAWDHHSMSVEQRDRFTRMAQSFLTALAAEGMVLVPKEPTERMKWVGHAALDQSEFTETAVGSRVGLAAMREVYRAMLSAHQADEKSEGK